jgi:hypothetical protein
MISAVSLAMALYPTLVLDLETVCCFLIDHWIKKHSEASIGFSIIRTPNPVTNWESTNKSESWFFDVKTNVKVYAWDISKCV